MNSVLTREQKALVEWPPLNDMIDDAFTLDSDRVNPAAKITSGRLQSHRLP